MPSSNCISVTTQIMTVILGHFPFLENPSTVWIEKQLTLLKNPAVNQLRFLKDHQVFFLTPRAGWGLLKLLSVDMKYLSMVFGMLSCGYRSLIKHWDSQVNTDYMYSFLHPISHRGSARISFLNVGTSFNQSKVFIKHFFFQLWNLPVNIIFCVITFPLRKSGEI